MPPLGPIIHQDRETNEFVLDESQFEYLLKSKEIADLPVSIVSICGDLRHGKSFILNFFLRYLKNYDRQDWIQCEPDCLNGFSWKHGINLDTVGIVIWPEPLVLQREDGTKIAVLLMDTQGFFDDVTDHQSVGKFYTISTLISSLQIYNQMHQLQSNHLTTLCAFTEYGNKISRKTGHKAFGNLLFLIRDWENSREIPYGHDGGNDYLRFKKCNAAETFGREWDKMESCYKQIDGFLMPFIGEDAIDDPDFVGQVSHLRALFVENLKALVADILSPENIPIKYSTDGKELKLWQVTNLLRTVLRQLKSTGRFEIHDFEQISDQSRASNGFIDAIMYHAEKLADPSNQTDGKITPTKFNEIEQDVIIFYLEETEFIDKTIRNNFFRDLHGYLYQARQKAQDKDSTWFGKFQEHISNNYYISAIGSSFAAGAFTTIAFKVFSTFK